MTGDPVGPVTRPLGPGDGELLQVATLGNVNWCGERFSLAEVVADPGIAHYLRLRPERGDFGLVLEQDSEPVGVAWALLLDGSDPGYGYLADDIPEVSLWVAPQHRGAGLGRRLLRDLLAESTRRGHAVVSLSVEDGNPARDLYLAEGFVAVAGREADGVLRWERPGAPACVTAAASSET